MKKTARILHMTTGLLLLLLVLISIIVPPLTRGERAVNAAVEKLDSRYVFHRAGPDTFDCSGLVLYCYGPMGIELPHSAREMGYDPQLRTLRHPFQFAVGDLIFFDTVSSDKDVCDHVGLWMGGNRFIHASSSKGRVIVSEFEDYWVEKFSWGKRLVWPFL